MVPLGFGQQHVHAVREAPASPLTEIPPGVVIRKPTRDDIDVLAALELSLPAHQQLSPCFAAAPPPSLEEARTEWDEDFGKPAFATFVGEVNGRVVGSAIGCSVELSSLHTGITPTRQRGTSRLRSRIRGRAWQRGGERARDDGARLGPRGGLRRDHDRLARHEPARLPHVAEARLPPDLYRLFRAVA